MTVSDRRGPSEPTRDLALAAARDEQTLRVRWEATQSALRQRFDEPLERATEISRRTLAWFPVRVWRRFLRSNGFLLAAGVSYQSLFAFFAALYLAFALAGLWVGGSQEAVAGLIRFVNTYIPGLISADGLVTPDQVQAVAAESAGVLTATGAIALGVVIWTAIGFVTFTRRAVRDTFGLPFDDRGYVRLKARDLVAAVVFGLALIIGWALGSIATWALDSVLELFGLDRSSLWSQLLGRVVALAVAFVLNSAALAALFRFLAGTSLGWRALWPGSLLGGAALVVLQVAAGLLIGYSPSNPLLATFAIFVGFLLWFRIVGVVILVAAAWIAVAAADRDIPLQHPSERDRLAAEHAALLTAAQERVRTALQARLSAPWYRVWSADRAVRAAEDELAEVEALLRSERRRDEASAPRERPHGGVGGRG